MKSAIKSARNSKVDRQAELYMQKQLKTANKLCRRFVNIYNTHELEEFHTFVEENFIDNFVCYDTSGTKIHPLTGTPNVEIQTDGIDNFKEYAALHFDCVPDGCLVVDKVRVMQKGKKISMKATSMGTVVKDCITPGAIDCRISALLSTDANTRFRTDHEVEKAVRNATFNRKCCFQFSLDGHNKIRRMDISSI